MLLYYILWTRLRNRHPPWRFWKRIRHHIPMLHNLGFPIYISLKNPVHFKCYSTKISSQFHWFSNRFSILRRNKHRKSDIFAWILEPVPKSNSTCSFRNQQSISLTELHDWNIFLSVYLIRKKWKILKKSSLFRLIFKVWYFYQSSNLTSVVTKRWQDVTQKSGCFPALERGDYSKNSDILQRKKMKAF